MSCHILPEVILFYNKLLWAASYCLVYIIIFYNMLLWAATYCQIVIYYLTFNDIPVFYLDLPRVSTNCRIVIYYLTMRCHELQHIAWSSYFILPWVAISCHIYPDCDILFFHELFEAVTFCLIVIYQFTMSCHEFYQI